MAHARSKGVPSQTGIEAIATGAMFSPHVAKWRHVGSLWDERAVGPVELDPAIDAAANLESPFVHGPVMTAAQQQQIVETRRAAIGPVDDMMRVAAARRAAGEAAGGVARSQRAPDRRRNRAGLAAHS